MCFHTRQQNILGFHTLNLQQTFRYLITQAKHIQSRKHDNTRDSVKAAANGTVIICVLQSLMSFYSFALQVNVSQ